MRLFSFNLRLFPFVSTPISTQNHVLLYRQFPKAIAAEAQRVLLETRATAEATIRAGAESAKADLAKAIAIAAKHVARDVARRQMIQWLVFGMLVGASLLGVGVYIGARAGI